MQTLASNQENSFSTLENPFAASSIPSVLSDFPWSPAVQLTNVCFFYSTQMCFSGLARIYLLTPFLCSSSLFCSPLQHKTTTALFTILGYLFTCFSRFCFWRSTDPVQCRLWPLCIQPKDTPTMTLTINGRTIVLNLNVCQKKKASNWSNVGSYETLAWKTNENLESYINSFMYLTKSATFFFFF